MKWYEDTGFLLFVGSVLGVVIAVFILFSIPNYEPRPGVPCDVDRLSFECKDSRVQDCINSERYSLDQCVILIGGQ